MFKNFLIKQMLKRQMKGIPEAEQEKIIKMVSENPELFQKIGVEVEEKMKGGMDQMSAVMQVMQKYGDDLKRIKED